MTHAEKARSLFYEGYNCSQSVMGAFLDVTGLEPETAYKLSSCFGGGMGRMREVCGALSAVFMVAGLLYGYDDPKARIEKSELYARVQELAARYRQQSGSIVCREILGIEGKDRAPTPSERTAEYYKKRPCAELCYAAAELLDRYMEENPVSR